tara:strand:+ start:4142 stop:5935 length:1794 start_codon:yes stop_codon:yes gene_type:complete
MKLNSNVQYLSKIIDLLSFLKRSTKINLVFILLIMFINSLLEFITIGSMIPFLTFVSNPNKALEIKSIKLFSEIFNIQQTNQLFIYVSILFLLIIISSGFIKIICIKLINDFSAILKIELGNKLYKKILYQDYNFHLNTNSSKLISSQIQQLDAALSVLNQFMLVSLSILSMSGIIISLIFINGRIVIFITTFSFVFYFLASYFTKKFVDSYGKIIFETRVNIIKIVQESLGYIRQIILDDSHQFFIKEYNKSNSKNAKANSLSTTIAQLPRYLMEIIILSAMVLVIMIMYLNGYDFYNSISIFGAFILGLQKLLPLFQKIFTSIYFIRQDRLNLYAVVSLLKETNKSISLISANRELIELNKNLEFKNISFAYSNNPEKKVLKSINFQLNRGDVIGIVGKTGAGKSTFIDLLLGLAEPTSGNIYIDGKKMNPISFRDFRLSVSSVPQDYFLLDRTIKENIVFGQLDSDINYSLLNTVLESSMLKEFVNSLPYGLETYVGEDGVRLSGGQKQRIAIARALYKKHSLLILDEATSSVDSETELNILKNISNMNKRITILMIAHRLQTLKNCDYIIELTENTLQKHNNLESYEKKYRSS